MDYENAVMYSGAPITTELENLVDFDDPNESMDKVRDANEREKIKRIESQKIPVYPMLKGYGVEPKPKTQIKRQKKIKFGKLKRLQFAPLSKVNHGKPRVKSSKAKLDPEMSKKIPKYMWTEVVLKEPPKVPELLFGAKNLVLSDYDCRASVELEFSTKSVLDMSIVFLKRKKQGKAMSSALKPRVDFVIVAQDRKADEAAEIVRSVTCKFGEIFRYGDTYWNSVDISELRWFYHLTDPPVIIEVRVEDIDSARRSVSKNGVLEWCVHQYREKQMLTLKGAIESVPSPYFYTARRGYRVQVNVWIYKMDTNENGVFFEICFLHGKFDQQLPKSFRHRTTVTLPGKFVHEEDVVQSVEMDIAEQSSYFVHVATNTEVAAYVVDGNLDYKVVIEPARKRNGRGKPKEGTGETENVKDEPKVGKSEIEEVKDEASEEDGRDGAGRGKGRRAVYKKMRNEMFKAKLREKSAAKRAENAKKRGVKTQDRVMENEKKEDGVEHLASDDVEQETGAEKSNETDDAKDAKDVKDAKDAKDAKDTINEVKQSANEDDVCTIETENVNKSDDAKTENGAQVEVSGGRVEDDDVIWIKTVAKSKSPKQKSDGVPGGKDQAGVEMKRSVDEENDIFKIRTEFVSEKCIESDVAKLFVEGADEKEKIKSESGAVQNE